MGMRHSLTLTPYLAGVPDPRFIQAVPLYLADDVDVINYFTKFKKEIDGTTGANLVILLAKQVEIGNADEIVKLFEKDSNEQKRFPGVRRGDLPCLWLEDNQGGTAILRLPNKHDDIRQLIRDLADVAPEATSAENLKERASKNFDAGLPDRWPWLRRIGDMYGIPDKHVAWISGVVFIVIMLVIALFVPIPSAFQYFVFRSVLAISVAAFASVIPGILKITIPNWLTAGGAFAVLVLVYLYNPAGLVASVPP
jgi:hypothetical protein